MFYNKRCQIPSGHLFWNDSFSNQYEHLFSCSLLDNPSDRWCRVREQPNRTFMEHRRLRGCGDIWVYVGGHRSRKGRSLTFVFLTASNPRLFNKQTFFKSLLSKFLCDLDLKYLQIDSICFRQIHRSNISYKRVELWLYAGRYCGIIK